MINRSEITQNFLSAQIAGLFPGDSNIELKGVKVKGRKSTFFLQNGITKPFTDLPLKEFNLLKTAYLQDFKAVEFISKIHTELKDQVELYAYYMWGDLDGTPDIANGVLSPAENFRDEKNCPSLLWNKSLTIDNYKLSPRAVVIIDLIAEDYKDAVIADAIGVSHSYFDQLKKQIFTYTNTFTKTALILKAKEQKVI